MDDRTRRKARYHLGCFVFAVVLAFAYVACAVLRMVLKDDYRGPIWLIGTVWFACLAVSNFRSWRRLALS